MQILKVSKILLFIFIGIPWTHSSRTRHMYGGKYAIIHSRVNLLRISTAMSDYGWQVKNQCLRLIDKMRSYYYSHVSNPVMMVDRCWILQWHLCTYLPALMQHKYVQTGLPCVWWCRQHCQRLVLLYFTSPTIFHCGLLFICCCMNALLSKFAFASRFPHNFVRLCHHKNDWVKTFARIA